VSPPPPVLVSVWSDYTCPFCYVATERVGWLESQPEVSVEWLPFDLHPEYPPEGISREELVKRHGQSEIDIPKQLTEEAGLTYAPHPRKVPSSRRALELTEWARSLRNGSHERLHQRIMDAYWAESRDISDWAVLADCVSDVDLDPAAGQDAVEAGAHGAAVDASTTSAQSAGINAVPAFVFDGRFLVPGAVPHEALGRAIEHARSATGSG
jgi:predicted DsbA family dithiol-disulfide isomerase